MDKLTEKQREEVKRMSTGRLIVKLTKAGYDEEVLSSMERANLMAEYAEVLIAPSEQEQETHEEDDEVVDSQEIELRKRELYLRERELELREKEMKRLELKDMEEETRRHTLTGQTKYYGGAMKHALPRMTNDPMELPGYFQAVENLFDLYEVPNNVRSKLIIPVLSDKAKSLISRLNKARLDKYEEVRDFLLREFRLSSEQYRAKFNTYCKPSEDTYTLYGSKLRNFLNYYFDSRKVTNKEEIIDLLLADRIKQTLADHILKHVLCAEGESWFKPDKLTNVIDVYMNSHVSDVKANLTTADKNTSSTFARANQAMSYSSGDDKNKHIKCWKCLKMGHRSTDCRSRVNAASLNPVQVNKTSQQGQRDHSVVGPRVNSTSVDSSTVALSSANVLATSVVSSPANNHCLPGYKPIISIPEIRFPDTTQVSDACLITEAAHVNLSCITNKPITRTVPLETSDVINNNYACMHNNDSHTTDVEHSTVSESLVALAKLQYMPILIKGIDQPIKSLKDSGAEIGVVQPELIRHLNLPHVGQITIRGIVGQPVKADLVMLEIKPYAEKGYCNIVPHLPVIFASCEIASDYDVILPSSIIEQLDEMKAYDVVTSTEIEVNDVTVAAMTLRSRQIPDISSPEPSIVHHNQILDTEGKGVTDVKRADVDTLKAEQLADETLKPCWLLAKQNKGHFYVKNDLLYHKRSSSCVYLFVGEQQCWNLHITFVMKVTEEPRKKFV